MENVTDEIALDVPKVALPGHQRATVALNHGLWRAALQLATNKDESLPFPVLMMRVSQGLQVQMMRLVQSA